MRFPLHRWLTPALWSVLLLSGGFASHAEDHGTPHPEAPPELRQFEFLIGPWNCEVDWLRQDGIRAQGQATWTGYWILDGRAIRDDFRGGFTEGYLATTFRTWDAGAKGWRGHWIDVRAGRWSRPLVEEEADKGLRLRTSNTFRNADGEPIDVEMRYHFHEIAARKFSWRQDTSLDGGKTWQEATTKIECVRPASWAPAGKPAAGRVNVDGEGVGAE